MVIKFFVMVWGKVMYEILIGILDVFDVYKVYLCL